ncbi:MAG: hypothetical protein IJM18_05495 [Clostridia bacterium]|nr:hypothetical protein [Clostridia bacterium]
MCNKTFGRILAALLALLVILSLFAVSAEAGELPRQDTEHSAACADIASEIIEKEVLISFGGRFPVYADYYGGAWFTGDGVLHVCLTDMTQRDRLVFLLGEYADAVEFLSCEHSLNEMNGLAQSVVDELRANDIKPFTCCADVKKQGTLVSVKPEDYDKVKTILDRRGIDWLFVEPTLGDLTFFGMTAAASPNIDINGGGLLSGVYRCLGLLVNRILSILTVQLKGGFRISTSQGGVTLGLCGRYQGYNAFASCGHAMPLNASVSYGNNVIVQ